MTAIALFADQNVIVPTHVALASTLAHWPGPQALAVYVFISGWSDADVALLEKTASLQPGKCVLQIREISLARVQRWKSLYGSLMPYGRLFLPELLADCKQILYLDVDVIVEMDVRKLVEASQTLGPVAALQAWDFEHSQDAALARANGIDLHSKYFHSGLLVMDLEWCRSQRLVERFLAFGDRCASDLNSHDQTVINLVLHGQLSSIPREFTTHLYATTPPPEVLSEAIHSFCGSPKPFDPLGNFLNANFELFNSWISQTALSDWSPNSFHEFSRVRKNVRLIRPMVGTALKMLSAKLRPS
jgi:lipopolysaccharide biosynthesis glycosyltransferase